MEVDGIDALQWTSGSYNPDGTNEMWFDIYDQVTRAGKGLWVQAYDGKLDDWIVRIDKLIKRYGSNALFIHFPTMDMVSAEKLLDHAYKNWQNVEGTFR